ncbi:hypothetical protein niasHT_021682 [Heterodera trifolii]|uniref:Uncharacterized protein n=1 Tax=Heterodera trifolii TaxID=157864 RepID=A0ABD2JSM8_9BILA
MSLSPPPPLPSSCRAIVVVVGAADFGIPRGHAANGKFSVIQFNFIRLKDSSRAASPPAGHSSAAAEAANLICRMSVTPQHKEKQQKNGARGGGDSSSCQENFILRRIRGNKFHF